ncbi:MAG: class I SAM-dependent methyltransferase [Phycisphaerae bacterium]|nr:class I SAM-dependent methyltransferase [Phycisphaerae bacterium]
MVRKQKTAYELGRSQVSTPLDIVKLFWRITHRYRTRFSSVLDMGAGDGRFALGGRYASYEGLEIDKGRRPLAELPSNAAIHYKCAFVHDDNGYAACIGNPPYVRHHDLNKTWRDLIAKRLGDETGQQLNRKCNLYVYFLFLALLKSRSDGLVSALVPYEWVSRPSASSLRAFIDANKWHVDTYRFTEPVFDGVLTTASISVIDKRKRDGQWCYFQLAANGDLAECGQVTGASGKILPYDDRGRLWAMRGMSPGTQKVFTLTEGQRVHAGLKHEDVLPCVTSLREVPPDLSHLTHTAFRKRFIDAGKRCWLIKSHSDTISERLQAYLDHVPKKQRNTTTCTLRDLWYRFSLADVPGLLISTGFTSFGPKVLVNSVGAHAVGSVCGVHSDSNIGFSRVREYLTRIDFEKRVVPHAKQLKKVEIRQLNAVLNSFSQWEVRDA